MREINSIDLSQKKEMKNVNNLFKFDEEVLEEFRDRELYYTEKGKIYRGKESTIEMI